MARHVKQNDPLLKSDDDDEENSTLPTSDSSPSLTRRDITKQRHVSLKQLAILINRDRNTIMKYLAEDMPYVEKADRDRGAQWVLDIGECVRWLEQRAAKNVTDKLGGGSSTLPSIDVIEQRSKAAKMYTLETEAAEAIGVVARIHDILTLIKRDYSEMRIKLMAVSETVGSKFEDKIALKVKTAIAEQIEAALESLRADQDVEKAQQKLAAKGV